MKSGRLDRDGILAVLRHIKPELADRFGVTRLALFGSFVRNDAHEESDIDVILYTPLMNAYLKTRIQNEAVYV